MNRMILGAIIALILVSVGIFWWQGRAQVEKAAPPPEEYAELDELPKEPDIPLSDAGNLRGPAPPEAEELTREQKRFHRYDRDRDGRITRNEMLSTRTKAFRKLDKDGNNLLTFEEWAVATATKFDTADRNRDRELSPQEFRATRTKKKVSRKCKC